MFPNGNILYICIVQLKQTNLRGRSRKKNKRSDQIMKNTTEFKKSFNSKYGVVEVYYLVQDGSVHYAAVLPEGCENVEHSTGFVHDGNEFKSMSNANQQTLTTRGEMEKAEICFAPAPYQGKKHRAIIKIGGPKLVHIARPMPSKSQEEAIAEFIK